MNTRRRRPIPLLLMALLPIALGAAPAPREGEQDAKGEAKAVPFEMLPSNHMVVKATINGKGPYRLIFDLGSPIVLLGNKAAEESGAIDRDAPRALLFATRGEGHIDTLEVGELTAKDLPVVVLDHPALKALGGVLGEPLDGIIGYTFFARYRTTIDYQERRMTFEPVDFEVRDALRDLSDRLMGPKEAESRMLSPRGLWGLTLGEPAGGLESRGVPVASVVPGSPADASGLRPGDVLTTLDGRWTTSINDVFEAASGVPPGRPATVEVLRDGEERTLTVTPREGI